MAAYLNTILDAPNKIIFKPLSKQYENLAKKFPIVDKIAILANHILRLLPMVALMQILPFAPLTNSIGMIVGAVFYRVTIERLCPLRFALKSCFGAIAVDIALMYTNPLGFVPLAAYAITIIHASFSTELKLQPCCGK